MAMLAISSPSGPSSTNSKLLSCRGACSRPGRTRVPAQSRSRHVAGAALQSAVKYVVKSMMKTYAKARVKDVIKDGVKSALEERAKQEGKTDVETGPVTKESALAAAGINVPQWLLPYIYLSRWHKPVGWWLFAWPGFVAITQAANTTSSSSLMALCLWGFAALALRGGTCTINAVWQKYKHADSDEEPKSSQPLRTGAITVPAAVTWYAAQCFVGLGTLYQMNQLTFWLGLASLPIMAAYMPVRQSVSLPVSKAILGVGVTCWGVVMGWAAATGTIDVMTALPVYFDFYM